MSSLATALKFASSPEEALNLYTRLHRYGLHLDGFCIAFTLKLCSPLHDAPTTRHLHTHILKLGLTSHVYVATSLLNAYISFSFPEPSWKALQDSSRDRSFRHQAQAHGARKHHLDGRFGPYFSVMLMKCSSLARRLEIIKVA